MSLAIRRLDDCRIYQRVVVARDGQREIEAPRVELEASRVGPDGVGLQIVINPVARGYSDSNSAGASP